MLASSEAFKAPEEAESGERGLRDQSSGTGVRSKRLLTLALIMTCIRYCRGLQMSRRQQGPGLELRHKGAGLGFPASGSGIERTPL